MSPRFAVNCSTMYRELPWWERPAAAAAAGFSAVEFWWPFDRAVPAAGDLDRLERSVTDAGVRLVGLNFFAGDLAGPDCGLVSIPARVRELRDSIEVAVDVGGRLGVLGFNALYGNRIEGLDPDEQDETAIEQLAFAAEQAAGIGATVLVEPISGPKPYPLRTAADVVGVLDRVGAANVGLLADLYHLAVNGDDVEADLAAYGERVAHVQIADAPGRHEPGTGELDLTGWLDRLDRDGYAGWVALEYLPRAGTDAGLAWLPADRR